jgi:hypothetical protein
VLSVVVAGVCAKATAASNADAARPAVIDLANMWFLPDLKLIRRKPATAPAVPTAAHIFSSYDVQN